MVLGAQASIAEPDHAMLYMSVPDRKLMQKLQNRGNLITNPGPGQDSGCQNFLVLSFV